MLKLLPGWKQVCRSTPRRRAKRTRSSQDLRYRRGVFEELEPRQLLAVDYNLVANSLDGQLLSMQSRIISAINSYSTGDYSKIPVVGDTLGSAAAIVQRFNQPLKDAISSLQSLTNPSDADIRQAIAGSSFAAAALMDRNGNGVGADDILLSRSGNTLAIQMRVGKQVEVVSTSLKFDTGLPGLPVKITTGGSLDVNVGFAYELAFSFDTSASSNSQATLDTSKFLTGLQSPGADHPIVDHNHALAIFVSAELSDDFEARARFGFVEGHATTISDPSDPNNNGLYGTLLIGNLSGAPTVKLDGEAAVNLKLAGSFAGTNDDFPGISTDFHLGWQLSSSAPASEANKPTIEFDNVSLLLGTFVSNLVEPVLTSVAEATAPLKPVLKVLNEPIPVLTDLSRGLGGGDITLADLGGVVASGLGYGPLYDLANSAQHLLDSVTDIDLSGSNFALPLGGFDLSTTDLRDQLPIGNIMDLSLSDITALAPGVIDYAAGTFENYIDDLPPEAQEYFTELTAGLRNGYTIEFPILDDPASVVFNMLLGRDSDLLYLEAEAHVDAQGSEASGLSIFNMGINFEGTVEVDTKFKFAYDTFGLRQLIKNIADGNLDHVASDILDGFYIADDSYFDITGEITAGAGASVGIFHFEVEGGIYTGDPEDPTPVRIAIADQSDNKLRLNELDGGILVSGSLDASLGVEVGIGKEILGKFIGVKKRFDLAHEVIVWFGSNDPPVLASQPDANGEVTLYLGQNAHLRTGYGLDNVDGDESFIIRQLAVNPDGSEKIKIIAFGVTHEIDNVRSIRAIDNLGNLTITAVPGIKSNVHFEGGQGSATLLYKGTGSAYLKGGALASTLTGGSGANHLIGGAGADQINGGSGSNILEGAGGDDIIILGSGSNTVFGGSGRNTIVVEAPIYQNATVVAGDAPDNYLQILGAPETFAISAVPSGGAIDVGIQNTPDPLVVHIMVSNAREVFINAQDSATNFVIGDLAAAGVQLLNVNIVSEFTTARTIDLDTRIANGASIVGVHDLVNQYDDPRNPGTTITEHGATIANSTTGLTARIFGFGGNDTFTFRHHGGAMTIDPLGFTSGHFVLDTSARNGNPADSIRIITPARVGGIDLTMTNSGGDVLITTVGYTSFKIQGDRTVDTLHLDVSAPLSGDNTLDLDASSLKGVFNVRMLGIADAINHVTLKKAGPDADVYIFGQTTTTDVMFGVGKLADIQHDATVSNVRLSIDNDQATAGSILTLNASTFGNWVIPTLAGVLPKLNISGLWGPLEIFAGAGDRFQLDVTPPSITGLTMHNVSQTVQDLVYIATCGIL